MTPPPRLNTLSHLSHAAVHYDLGGQIAVDRCFTFGCVEKRDNSSDIKLEVAKRLYNELVEKLGRCRAGKLATTTPTLAPTGPVPCPACRDCQAYFEHGHRSPGIYKLTVSLNNPPTFDAWCDFFGNHGWTVIQRRDQQKASFNRSWQEYQEGFGRVDGEHWLGNEKIHLLTQTNQKLNIQLVSSNGRVREGTWQWFIVGSESENYKLGIGSNGYNGTLRDEFSFYHHGLNFTTYDRDNDRLTHFERNCAISSKGGWWYDTCSNVNLNKGNGLGMFWYVTSERLLSSVMRITR
ncbi:angiopoietin-related protein 7-like [Watersipora subatra]|uniref:angiopoietin-related protein 7-like n=1 Tax=Watersipora subatra TaxID=2589382 RepID=UPI00355C462B